MKKSEQHLSTVISELTAEESDKGASKIVGMCVQTLIDKVRDQGTKCPIRNHVPFLAVTSLTVDNMPCVGCIDAVLWPKFARPCNILESMPIQCGA